MRAVSFARSFPPKTVIEQAVRMLINDIKMNDADSASFAHYNLDIAPEEFETIGVREYQRRLRHWAEERVYDALSNIEWLGRHGTIPIWREITAPANWTPDAQHPGIYWSWDQHAAEAHWGNFDGGNVKWLMHARVAMKNVDWPATLAMNANPDYESEKEIRLKPNTPIKLEWWKRVD